MFTKHKCKQKVRHYNRKIVYTFTSHHQAKANPALIPSTLNKFETKFNNNKQLHTHYKTTTTTTTSTITKKILFANFVESTW